MEEVRCWLMSKYGVWIPFLAKSCVSLVVLLGVTILIHESAHFVAARLMHVPIASFSWFDPRYFAPAFVSGSSKYMLGEKIVSYSGGLVTGVVLLSILSFKRKWFRLSLYRWFLGFYIATFGLWQISQGILEGAFHDMYIADAINIFSLSYFIGYAFAFLGMISYWLLMPGVKDLIAKESNK